MSKNEPLTFGDVCGNCRAFCAGKQAGREEHGECRFNPPVASILVIPQNTLQGPQMIPQVMAAWPPVHKTQWCLNFVTKDKKPNLLAS